MIKINQNPASRNRKNFSHFSVKIQHCALNRIYFVLKKNFYGNHFNQLFASFAKSIFRREPNDIFSNFFSNKIFIDASKKHSFSEAIEKRFCFVNMIVFMSLINMHLV